MRTALRTSQRIMHPIPRGPFGAYAPPQLDAGADIMPERSEGMYQKASTAPKGLAQPNARRAKKALYEPRRGDTCRILTSNTHFNIFLCGTKTTLSASYSISFILQMRLLWGFILHLSCFFVLRWARIREFHLRYQISHFQYFHAHLPMKDLQKSNFSLQMGCF